MIFKKYFIFMLLFLCVLLVGESVAQQDAFTGNISMGEAKNVAEQYLKLVKDNDYDELFNMHYRPENYDGNDEQENKEAHIEILKFYNEEVGDIISYQYKSFKWHKPVMKRHWASDKNPLVDEPSKTYQEPESLTLIYSVQYEKDTADTTLEILKQDNQLKVRRFGLNYPFSFEAIQRMMRFQNKANEMIQKTN